MKCTTYYNGSLSVSAVWDYHPDTNAALVHFVEVNGKPLRTSQGGIVTYPDRDSAIFAAKCIARRSK